MEVKKTIYVKFSDEEEKALNKVLELVNKFTYSDVCGTLDCDDCPFKNLCNYHEAETIERKINKLLCE